MWCPGLCHVPISCLLSTCLDTWLHANDVLWHAVEADVKKHVAIFTFQQQKQVSLLPAAVKQYRVQGYKNTANDDNNLAAMKAGEVRLM